MNENTNNQIVNSTKASKKYSDATHIDNLVCMKLKLLKLKIIFI